MSDYQFVDGTRLISVVEAIIFASPDPISWDHLAGILEEGDEQIKLDQEMVAHLVAQLNDRYEANDLAFRVVRSGGGYTFATSPRFHRWLSIFQHENAYRKLSQSAIEALAIVAYRQPITKPEVDQIRGVDSGYIIRQLMEKMLIRVAGRADSPGKPLLYKTTDHFLRHFGINSVEELPRPREIDEILQDDDMAEHRRLLMERQMELNEEEAGELMNHFLKRKQYDEEADETIEIDRKGEEGPPRQADGRGDGQAPEEVNDREEEPAGERVESADEGEAGEDIEPRKEGEVAKGSRPTDETGGQNRPASNERSNARDRDEEKIEGDEMGRGGEER